ncbi:hypothetical protein TspCOW1_19370 [Thiohalobacter sp. COW1]|uniref:HPt domain-containing protein n=1 Tax=Thiohalobacter thiocyanaticus TaxID=585455 RepID=A0A1Z4VPK0_9GAMM|nr:MULTISPECIES: Hpt domain-containing protein [Thiohalobacter]BAZ93154.1 uncharacterized protein FOKN1_0752 [Thiohalobacter thiocyanaticus]BCO31834.1 hypothetical protein TspCOW1_19370 [Thiohalobacter sp. COW1]
MVSTDDTETVQAQLQALHERYQLALPERLAELNAHGQRLCRDGWEQGLAEQLQRELHNLAGGASTFGHPELGQAAGVLEQQLRRWLERDALPPASECEAFRDRLQSLAQLATAAPVPPPTAPTLPRR